MFHVPERTHAGLLLMTSLAERYADQGFVSLQVIAADKQLSQAYLEEIAALLRRHALIEGRQGPRGGYRLQRAPADISLADITQAIEGELALVECQKKNASCPLESGCKTKHMWQGLQASIETHLTETSLADMLS